VLVTGAAGFIGSALCERFDSVGDSVIAYDNLSRGRREYLPPAVRLIEGDIRDRAGLEASIAASKPDCVVHLAAMHFIPDCIARPRETTEVNVEGTRRVLDACRGSSVRHVIFVSSAAVYAPVDGLCDEDETPLEPLEVYGESKLAAEELVAAFHEDTGVATTTLRLFNAIGARETNPHVIPHIFESLQKSDAIELGNVTPCRDYVDTRDVAAAIAAVLQLSEGHRVFNVGTGVASSVTDVLDLLRRITGRPIAVVQDSSRVRPAERMILVGKIDRIRRATGWAPRLGLEESLKDLVIAYGLQTTAAR
jgi:UDP-glucose 4-epimerase